MLSHRFGKLVLASLIASATLATSVSADAAPAWIRGLTIIGVSETDNYIEVNIVTSGTIQWLSIPASSAMASRFLASATAAWLAGKPLDVKVDLAATQGCGGLSNCENVLGWYLHN